MWPNPPFPADLVTFTEEILKGKLDFLCSDITPGYWAFDQLLFSLARYVASPAPTKLHQDIHKFYFIKMTIEHFTYLHSENQRGLRNCIVVSTKRLDVFCFYCCSLIRKNVFVRLFSVLKTYNKFLSDLIKRLESFLVVPS